MPEQYVHVHRTRSRTATSERPLRYSDPVGTMIGTALPVTLSLIIGGTILWLLIAFPIGVISALYGRDRSSTRG